MNRKIWQYGLVWLVATVPALSAQDAVSIYPFQLKGSSRWLVNSESPQTQETVEDTLARSPGGASVRSLVFPGWGQLYNDRPLKALLFLVGDATMLTLFFVNNGKVQDIDDQRSVIDRQLNTDPFLSPETERILEGQYTSLTSDLDLALNERNLFGWLFVIVHLSGVIDAYVDAHLFGFDDKVDLGVVPSPTGTRLTLKIQL